MEEFFIGEKGSAKIKSTLESTETPIQTIKELQRDMGIGKISENVEPSIFEFTDICGHNRPSLYHNIVLKMQENLLQSIPNQNSTNLEKLLELTFPYLNIEELKIIPLTILQKIEKIPEKYLAKLAISPNTFSVFKII